jgi:hypothetical protein
MDVAHRGLEIPDPYWPCASCGAASVAQIAEHMCTMCADAYALCPACGGRDEAEEHEDIDDDNGRIVEFWVECTGCGRRVSVVGRENGSVPCDCGADCRYLPELTRWAAHITVSVAQLHDFIAGAARYCPTCPEDDRVAYVETWALAQFFAGPDVSADTSAKPRSSEDL